MPPTRSHLNMILFNYATAFCSYGDGIWAGRRYDSSWTSSQEWRQLKKGTRNCGRGPQSLLGLWTLRMSTRDVRSYGGLSPLPWRQRKEQEVLLSGSFSPSSIVMRLYQPDKGGYRQNEEVVYFCCDTIADAIFVGRSHSPGVGRGDVFSYTFTMPP